MLCNDTQMRTQGDMLIIPALKKYNNEINYSYQHGW
jgi:hypothetical protein